MAFGVVSKGYNGFLGLNSDWPSLVFIGKATWTGQDSVFPADHQSFRWTRNFGPFQPSTSEGPIAGTGQKQFYARAETLNCGDILLTATTPNDNGIFQYEVFSPQYPHIFCNSTLFAVTASILGVRNTGILNSDGWPKWIITVTISYPSGLRTGAVQFVSLYCFSATYDTPSPGAGIRTFRADSSLAFNSDLNPLRVKNLLTITSSSLPDPSDLASIIFNDSLLDNPPVPTTSLVKPAFLNVDWARYVVARVVPMGALFRRVVFINAPPVCSFLTNPAAAFTQIFLTTGVRFGADGVSRVYSLTGLDAISGSITVSTTPSTSISKLEALPVYIPIIDGADYD